MQSNGDACVKMKMKNAMFQPAAPELLNYHTWVSSEYAQSACQVGLTGIQSSRNGRITSWQFVFLLRDAVAGHQSKSGRAKPSLLFGEVTQGIDVIKSLCARRPLCWTNEGLHLTLEVA